MTDREVIHELLKVNISEEKILSDLPYFLAESDSSGLIDFLAILEDSELFKGRLPLRLKIYARLAENSDRPYVALIALVRLLRRLGSRKDLPNLGGIPEQLPDFTKYLASKAFELIGETPLAYATEALASATGAFREGDLAGAIEFSKKGLGELEKIPEWSDPSDCLTPETLAIAEIGHELIFLAADSSFRSGEVSYARETVESWAGLIEKWEEVLGPLSRQRYQYYQLTGHIQDEVGLFTESIESYEKALDYAPTPYRRAFLWLSMAQVERELGLSDQSWRHAVDAIEAWLESPFPQTATPWIEWLGVIADRPDKLTELKSLRKKAQKAGGTEINRVVSMMTRMYKLLTDLRSGVDPVDLIKPLDSMIEEFRLAGSWSNLITLLAAKAVISGRLEDRFAMESAVNGARECIEEHFPSEARAPQEFFLENAHALALRNVGAYEEAFETLFEKGLEARTKYPGGFGPEEQTALEALYYLGALAGYDPDTIEGKIRSTLRESM